MGWWQRWRGKSGHVGQAEVNEPGTAAAAMSRDGTQAKGGTVLRSPGAPAVAAPLPVPAAPGQVAEGELLAGIFRVKRAITGGMGTVYVCRHTTWDTEVAVKVPHADIVADPDGRRRFTVEAETWTTAATETLKPAPSASGRLFWRPSLLFP